MKRIALLICLLSVSAFSETETQAELQTELQKDVAALTQNAVKTEQSFEKVLSDIGKCIQKNIPSPGTLIVDGLVDACLRQSETLANAIKELEKINPINGAIVRDFSKTLTVIVKMYLEIPVDLSGRLYDRSDLYSQITKVVSKGVGFGSLYMTGVIMTSALREKASLFAKVLEAVLMFSVNNGGDVLSQSVLDAGANWRKNPNESFEEYLMRNYSIRNSMFSIPVKSTASYAIGWIMNKIQLIDAVEMLSLVMLNQVTFNKDKANAFNTATWNKKTWWLPGMVSSLVTAVVKSTILTSLCKAAVAGINSKVDAYFAPAKQKAEAKAQSDKTKAQSEKQEL